MREVREIEELDAIVIGGDVLPGPMPHESIDFLMNLDLPVTFIRGNGDREVLACMRGRANSTLPKQAWEAIQWTAEALGSRHEQMMAFWNPNLLFEIAGMGNVFFCHATPRSDTETFTRLTPDERVAPMFQQHDAGVFVCGHTHMQFDRRIGKIRILNAGSVGMPFGQPGAYWLSLGPEGPRFRRTSFDLREAAARVRKTDYPQADDFAENNILHPPAEEAMLGVLT